MVDRYLFPTFGVNSFSGIRENDIYGRRTDGRRTNGDGRRRTTDARVTTVALLCISKKQSKMLPGES